MKWQIRYEDRGGHVWTVERTFESAVEAMGFWIAEGLTDPFFVAAKWVIVEPVGHQFKFVIGATAAGAVEEMAQTLVVEGPFGAFGE